MNIEKEDIINGINRIREEIGHQKVNPSIKDIIYQREKGVLILVTADRPDKSAVIGKGGWVVGKLKEELKVNSIHIEAYPDILLQEYRIKLAINRLKQILGSQESIPLKNLLHLLNSRLENIHNFEAILKDMEEEKNNSAVIALSGGVDSSFSLIVAKKLGFNPVAVTVDPGSIILPQYFKNNIKNLTDKLNVKHEYVTVQMDDIIKDSLDGRFHPCGRCSKVIEEAVLSYAKRMDVPFLIYGDLLTTGSNSILQVDGMIKINLPAMLSMSKGEIKKSVSGYEIHPPGGYGCPLVNEVHKKHPHMRKFSLQRILRETRAGVMEPGEALEMIMKII